jgi:hypothetical protein
MHELQPNALSWPILPGGLAARVTSLPPIHRVPTGRRSFVFIQPASVVIQPASVSGVRRVFVQRSGRAS